MQYTFTCPLEGCSQVMTAEAQNDDEAVDKLIAQAKEHLAAVHPDVHKTDDEVKNDIRSMMVSGEKNTSEEKTM